MHLKLFGATIVILACAWFGFSAAAAYRRDMWSYRAMIRIVDYMECELSYRLTPLPQLCRQTAEVLPTVYGQTLMILADELESQISPDTFACIQAAMAKTRTLHRAAQECFLEFGRTLGKFDLQGQLKGLNGIRQMCDQRLKEMEQNKDARLRSYQTLGLCAGAALAILLI